MKAKLALLFLGLAVGLTGAGCGLDPFQQAMAKRDAAYSRGDWNAAIQAYTEAIQIDHTNPDAYAKRSAAYQANGQKELALSDYEEADFWGNLCLYNKRGIPTSKCWKRGIR